jgi:hypothetical protein
MSVRAHTEVGESTGPSRLDTVLQYFVMAFAMIRAFGARRLEFVAAMMAAIKFTAAADNPRVEAQRQAHVMRQMGAKRIGSLAIGIAVVGIVLNQMSDLSVVSNSTGVVDVSGIFDVAGAGLNLLVIGVIIAAAAVLLSLWSGF